MMPNGSARLEPGADDTQLNNVAKATPDRGETQPVPDLHAAERFFTLMAEGEPVTFQTFDDRGKNRSLAKILHGDIGQLSSKLVGLNIPGAGVFWTVNFTDGKGRQAENITGVRSLFVDLDGAPLEPVLSCGIEPHVVVESSLGRWHAYWAVSDVQLAQFKPLQQAIARRFGGDLKVCDLPRVMRVPGFVHHKAAPFLSRIVSTNAVQPYAVADLIQRLQLRRVESRPAQAAPCGQGMIEGNRNASLASIAGTMRRRGVSADAIEGALQAINIAQCVPPLEADEVSAIARSIGRYAPVAQTPAPADAPDVREVSAPSWPEPLLPSTARVPEITADILPGWLGAMAGAVSASTQTPPAMSVMMILAILAAVLQRRFEISPWGDAYTEPLALWTIVTMASASRKTAVSNVLLDVLVRWEKSERDRTRREINRVFAAREVILKRIEQLKHNAGRENDRAARDKLQEEIARERDAMPAETFAPRIVAGDITGERTQGLLAENGERIAIISDEPGIFQNLAGLYSGGMSSLDIFLKGHAGSSVRVDRAGRIAHLDKPAVSFGLAIQPGILTDTGKTKRFRDSGLMARFLYAVPLSNVGQRDVRVRDPIADDLLGQWEQNIAALLQDIPSPIGAPRVLTFAPAAREVWLELAAEIEAEQGDGGRYAHMSDWTGKLPGAVARIACLLELGSKGLAAPSVSVGSAKRAVHLARLLVPHAEAAFRLMGAADAETDAMALLDWIKRNHFEDFTRRDAQKSLQARFPTLERLLPAIKLLQEWSVLSMELTARQARGAPSRYYRVNPRIYVIKSIKP